MGFEEILIIAGIAVLVIGPQRLPEYAEQLGKLVRNVRQMATGATETIREELGDEIADLDFSKFDPRQYDPRRIVREALLEDLVPATKPARAKTATKPPVKPTSAGGPTTKTTGVGKRASAATAAAATTATAAALTSTEDAPVEASADADAPVTDTPTTEDAAVESTTDATGEPALVGAAAVDGSDLPPFDDEAT